MRNRTRAESFRLAAQWSLVVGLLVLGVLGLSGDESGVEADRSIVAKGLLERLPTEPSLYCILGGLMIGLFIEQRRRSRSLARQMEELQHLGETDLSGRDWWVVEELRKRALGLRVRADWILVGVVGLLFGGLYVVAFVLSDLRQDELIQVSGREFQNRIGGQLDRLAAGRQWVKVDEEQDEVGSVLEKARGRRTREASGEWRDVNVRIPIRSSASVSMIGASPNGAAFVGSRSGSVYLRPTGKESWVSKEPGLSVGESMDRVALSEDGQTILVGGGEGSVFLSTDGGVNWTSPDDGFQPGADLTALTVSSDGGVAFVADIRGSVFLRRSGEESWVSPELRMSSTEWIDRVALSEDGQTILAGGDEGSVFLSTDGGGSWTSPDDGFQPGAGLTALTVSSDGGVAFVADTMGSVFLRRSGEESWVSPELSESSTEWVDRVALSEDGQTVLVGGDEGSVFLSTDGGGSWTSPDDGLKPGAVLTALTVSSDGGVAFVADTMGSVFLRRSGEESWVSPELSESSTERIDRVALSEDGQTILVGGGEGSVFLSTDGGESWTSPDDGFQAEPRLTALTVAPAGNLAIVAAATGEVLFWNSEDWETLNLDLSPTEWITRAILRGEGVSLLAGDEGSVFQREQGGDDWAIPEIAMKADKWFDDVATSEDGKTRLIFGDNEDYVGDDRFVVVVLDNSKAERSLDLGWNTKVVAADLSSDGRRGLVAGDNGSVFVGSSTDKVWEWESVESTLRPAENITAVAVSSGGEFDIIAGKDFAVVTVDGGSEWSRTEGLHGTVGSLYELPDGEGYIAETTDENFFLLKTFGELLSGWENLTLEALIDRIAPEEYLGEADLVDDIGNFAAEYRSQLRGFGARDGEGGWFRALFSDVRMMQGATLTVLFLLVSVLVRLHQYNLRLAAFWESRSDAVLLARRFAQSYEKMRFDRLVESLAPDMYDFKAQRIPALSWLSPRTRS